MPGNLQLLVAMLGAGLLIWNISCLAQGQVPFARASNVVRRSEEPTRFFLILIFQTVASVALLLFGLIGALQRT